MALTDACVVCGKLFCDPDRYYRRTKRYHAQTCSGRCRVALHRLKKAIAAKAARSTRPATGARARSTR